MLIPDTSNVSSFALNPRAPWWADLCNIYLKNNRLVWCRDAPASKTKWVLAKVAREDISRPGVIVRTGRLDAE